MVAKPKRRNREWSETRPLLLDDDLSRSYSGPVKARVTAEVVMMKKHVTLLHAIGMIVGGVAGSGIFISPTGVTTAVGSVGLSLIIWATGGLLNLLLALCYAELGTALPYAGGDYAYLHHILGPLPAFLCLWTTVLLIGPCCGALMGRTVGLYIFSMFGIECSDAAVVLMAVWVNMAMLNSYSVKWAARILTVLSFAKLLALGVIIIAGIVKISTGETKNFDNIFEGSHLDLWSLTGGFLPGFVAYVGWDAVNSLAEEMKNPGRDLPLSVTISMIVVIVIYVLTNMAYFSVLTPAEFIASDAVAMSFAERTLGAVAWTIPLVVAMSAGGSAVGAYLSYPRYAFAGGRERQLPQVLSYVSLHHFTPIPGIILVLLVAIFLTSSTFFDLQDLLSLGSVINQVKMAVVLVALLRLKWTNPTIERAVKVPFLLVLLALLILLCVLGLAVIQQPMVNGVGLLLFLIGIPMYFAGTLCASNSVLNDASDSVTVFFQQLFHLVPGGKKSSS